MGGWSSIRLKNNRLFSDIDYSALGFVLLLFKTVFIALLGTTSMIIGFDTKAITTVFYLLIWLLFILGIWKNGIHLTQEGGIFFVSVLLIGLLSLPFSSKQYLWNVDQESFITFHSTSYFHAALYIPLVFSIKDIAKLKMYLSFFARIFMLFVVINDYFVINVLSIKREDDMMYSYGVVLATCILIHDYSKSKNKLDLLLCLLGVLSALLSGTRGPLVCIIVCFFLSYINKISSKITKFIFVILSVFFVFFGGVKYIMQIVSSLLISIGFDDIRIVQYQEDNLLLDSSGRNELISKAWDAIVENGILGGGIGYDRKILGTYAHNIAIEFLCDFGLLFGSILIVVIIVICYKFIKSTNRDIASMGIILFSSIIVKLLFSSSYLIIIEFFLMLGLYFNNKRKSQILTEPPT